MAGVKGRSGGARAGAGRKPNPENAGAEYAPSTTGQTPLEALETFMNDPALPAALRLKAAGLAAPFRHKKMGEGTKAGAGKTAPEGDGPGKYKTRRAPGAATTH
jgi:phage terminase small subunit